MKLFEKRPVAAVVMVLAIIVGIIACIQYRLNFFLDDNTGSLWGWLDKIVFDIVPFEITQLHYALRAYSTFPNPNMLAQYLVMVAPFVACFNFCERRHDLRYFSRICLFLTFAGIMFSLKMLRKQRSGWKKIPILGKNP